MGIFKSLTVFSSAFDKAKIINPYYIVAILILGLACSYFFENGVYLRDYAIPALFVVIVYIFIDKKMSKKINQMNEATKKVQEVTVEIEAIAYRFTRKLNYQEDMDDFKDFIEKESYWSVAFKDSSEESECKITLQKDSKNLPIIVLLGDLKHYIVKVEGPANSLDELDYQIYEKSPIRQGEYYYCAYCNDGERYWELSLKLFGVEEERYKFMPTYKKITIYEDEDIKSANELMRGYEDPLKDLCKIGRELKLDIKFNEIKELKNNQRATLINFYKDNGNNIFFTINDSPPKKICFSNNNNALEKWTLQGNFSGYADSNERLEDLKNTITMFITDNNIEVKKVEYYLVKEYLQ